MSVHSSFSEEVRADALEIVVCAVECGEVGVAPRAAHAGAGTRATRPAATLALATSTQITFTI